MYVAIAGAGSSGTLTGIVLGQAGYGVGPVDRGAAISA